MKTFLIKFSNSHFSVHRHIQNLVKHLRLSFLQNSERLSADNYFHKKLILDAWLGSACSSAAPQKMLWAHKEVFITFSETLLTGGKYFKTSLTSVRYEGVKLKTKGFKNYFIFKLKYTFVLNGRNQSLKHCFTWSYCLQTNKQRNKQTKK